MKKTIIMCALMVLTAINANAQLMVESDGKALVGDHHWNSEFVNLESYAQYSSGQSKPVVVGLKSSSGTYYNNAVCIGVEGYSSNPIGSISYGVAGYLDFVYNGAGVFGTTGSSRLAISGKYAGYFNGNTYVNGTLTTTSLNNLSDIRLKENIMSLSHLKDSKSTLNKIKGLDALSYTFKDREVDVVDTAMTNKTGVLTLNKQIIPSDKKTHFGLSAQDLQKIYPELVSEGQDGYLTINYIELIPLLIRCVQEMQDEIEHLQYANNSNSRSTTSVNTAFTNGNVLYQNTPNPFKEQTTIRFSLADDAQSASICIFDMTGKMLKNLPISSGDTSVSLNGWELGEGMFLYTLIVNGKEIDTKRMIITK